MTTASPAPGDRRLRLGAVAALFFGLALITGLITWVGWRPVLAAVASVGVGGFLIFCAYWAAVLVVLGLAWFVVAPGLPPSRAGVFVWGRMVREGASDILPFSQVGGLLLGAQAVIAGGVSEVTVLASTVMDLTTEMFAQIVYTLLGVAILALHLSGAGATVSALWLPALVLLLVVGATAVFVGLQRRGIGAIGWLAQRFLPDGMARGEAVAAEVGAIYDRRGRMAAGAALHLLGWVAASVGSWIGLRLMGAPLPLASVIAVESLMFAARSVGFAVPGALGVQEGAYLLAGPLLGLHAETAVALSLLKRARDLAIGAPTLLIWQAVESRRLLTRPEPT
jgi:putative membrane protein